MEEKKVSIINIDDNRWMNYLSTKEEAMIFHHPNWLKNLCESYNFSPFVIAVLNDDNTISAGVPFAEIKSPLTGRRWVSLPYSDYCFPLYDDADDLELLTDFIVEERSSSRVQKIELRWEYPDRQCIKRNYDHVFHIKQLPNCSEDYFNSLKRNECNFVRQSRERGVTVKRGTSKKFVKEFYNLQLLTRARHGLPAQPWRYFELLQKNIFAHGLGFILLAFSNDGCCVAGLVILHWNKTVTVKYSASCDRLKSELRPNDLLTWEAIKWACDSGYEKIDEGRALCTNTGLRRFKTKWKLEERPLIYSTIGYPESSITRSGLSRIFEKIIQHSPPFVCRIVGELLYKHFS